MSIEVRNITKKFGSFAAVSDINLRIETGELVALLGPSGSGKTTLLRIIAGLEEADAGQILFDGEDATSRSVRDRGIGFVFQHYALFRHLTVYENVAFGLRVRPRKSRPSKAEIRDRVYELLRLVQLEEFAKRYPSQLSGGQCQRVALARALAIEPKVLLLDEPFGALDAKVRQELRDWLRKIHDELHITSVFVTHDQEEALEVADRVVVMNSGQVVQVGTPEEVYCEPATPFVFDFLGRVNRLAGLAHGGKTRIGAFEVDTPEFRDVQNARAVCFVRPHDVEVARENPAHAAIEARVRHINIVGPTVRTILERCDTGDGIEAEMSGENYRLLDLRADEPVFVKFRKVKVFLEGGSAQQQYASGGPEDFSLSASGMNAKMKVSEIKVS